MTTQTAPLGCLNQTLAETSELIRQRKVSPVELVASCLARIDRLQPRINAFITVTAEAAMEAATLAEKEISEGRWIGPLHGIPIGVKDFYDTAGVRTTAAFEHFKDRVPLSDATAVVKLKEAGAIIVGKTNMHALGMGTTGLESWFGPVKNPWNADYIPGGSSSGSAAAVATGMCYATLDTDAIGSCRLPAACCGVAGFKGTFGSIDLNGILADQPPPDDAIRWLSHAGITTRSAADTALVFQALAECDSDDSLTDPSASAAAMRIAVASNCPPAPGAALAFDRAIQVLGGIAKTMSSMPAPLTDFRKGLSTISADRAAVAAQVFGSVDALVLPTIPTTAPLVTEAAQNRLGLSPEYTMFANYYGLPAVSVPCGCDAHGLPLSLQIVGKPHAEHLILRLAHRFEQAANCDPILRAERLDAAQ